MKSHVPRLGMLPVFSHTAVGMALIAALAGFLVFGGGTNTRAGGDAPQGSEELAADGAAEGPGDDDRA